MSRSPVSQNPRSAALAVLRAWEDKHLYAETLIDRQAMRKSLNPSDRALLQAIIYAVLRHRRSLDAIISSLRKGKLDMDTRNALRVGLAQIFILNIADHAVVNETVNASKAAVRGLINAVLRRAITQKKQLVEQQATLPVAQRFSHPDWLASQWKKTFGKQHAQALMEWNNTPAPLFCWLNPLKKESLLLKDDPLLSPAPAKGFYTLSKTPPQNWLTQGLLYIQDPSTAHSIELLAPQPHEKILDACAAPGGKSAKIACAMDNKGALLCTDSNEKRLPRLKENLHNLGVSCQSIACHDWTKTPPIQWLNSFDAILLDVPCSNTGVMRRRIDVRWRLHPEMIKDLQNIQHSILHNASLCLKPEGRLVYSTCSIDPHENQDCVAAFLEKTPSFYLQEERIITPFSHHSDGAYAALCIKKNT